MIKKHKNKNEYYLTNNKMWVRNFTKLATPVDINKLTNPDEYNQMIEREFQNKKRNLPDISSESIQFDNCVVVSDGYNFEKNHQILKELPGNVAVLCTNRSLAKWSIKRKIDYYVVNNPYNECMSYIPAHQYFPRCLASIRTYIGFIKSYRGLIYTYTPVSESTYSGSDNSSIYRIDDYRNPICAAIGLSYRFGVRRLALFCCDDVFGDERPGSIRLENGLWMYPQQKYSHGLIEGNLYWLSHQEDTSVEVVDCSSGPNYSFISRIGTNDLVDYFTV
jgi:hypothetical protein